jgi:predicted DNA-binding protein YlxM (UPF0122 family)|nr:MAG TPA: NinG recombination protein [Crassvirales sp.]
MNESKLSNVTKEELEKLIFGEKLSYEEIGRRYEVSGSAIKKKAKKLGIELPKKRDINFNETFNKGYSFKYNKKDLEKYLGEGKSYKEIGNIYGVSSSSIYRAVKSFGLSPKKKSPKKKESKNLNKPKIIINSVDDSVFSDYVKDSLSIAEVARSIGIDNNKINTSVYREIHKRIDSLKLDTSHFTGGAWNVGDRFRKIDKGFPLSEVLVKNSSYKCTNSLRKKLFNEGVKERKCECCGITEWNGKPAPLQLHHIDGDNTNNSLENLQILCPNCHAQTDNYCSKNKNV